MYLVELEDYHTIHKELFCKGMRPQNSSLLSVQPSAMAQLTFSQTQEAEQT